MRTCFVATIVTAVIVFLAAFLVRTESSREGKALGLDIMPHQKMQARIEHVIGVLVNTKMDAPEKLEAVGTLSELRNKPGEEELFRQLFYFSSTHKEIEDVTLYTMVLTHRYLRISDFTVIRVVMPYLYSENMWVRHTAREFLEAVIGSWDAGIQTCIDYSDLEYVLDRNIDGPELMLVRFMYELSPGDGVLAMRKNFSDKPEQYRDVLWAEHVVSDAVWKRKHRFEDKFAQVKPEAIAELKKLSKHEAWWARLYVADILKRYRHFRTPEVVEQLKIDEHELVREAISRRDEP